MNLNFYLAVLIAKTTYFFGAFFVKGNIYLGFPKLSLDNYFDF